MRPLSRVISPLCVLLLLALLAGPAPALGGYGTVKTIGSGADTITVLYAGGTPYEIGYYHGSLLRSQVQYVINTCLPLARAEAGAGVLAAAWAMQAPYVPAEFNEELQGLADGSGVALSELQEMAAIPDVSEYHCSNFAAFGAATAGGQFLQMRLLDWAMELRVQDTPVIFVIEPQGRGLKYVNVGFAAMIGSIAGMNNRGIALGEMGDSFDYSYERIDGFPMAFLMRQVIGTTTNFADALSLMQNARRTSSLWYMLGDSNQPTAALLQTSPVRFDYWLPGTEPSPLPTLADVSYGGHYNDRLYADLLANYGSITPEVAIAISRHNAMSSNLMDVVFAPQTTELWAAYADGLASASTRPFVHLDAAAPPDRVDDNFDNAATSSANWYALGPKVSFTGGVMQVQGADDPTNTISEGLAQPARGKAFYVDGLTMAADVKIVSGIGGLAWGSEGLTMGPSNPRYSTHVVQLDPANDQVAVGTESEGGLAAATVALEFNTWYRVQVVSTLTNFEVWLAPRGGTLAKVIDVAQDIRHPGTDSHWLGGLGCFADNVPASTVQFDNFTAYGAGADARRFICPVVRAVPGQPVVVPVYVNDAGSATRLNFDLRYDAATLTSLSSSQVGSLVSGLGGAISVTPVAPGHVRVQVTTTSAIPAGTGGEAARLTFAVSGAAVPRTGASLLDLDLTAMYAGGTAIAAGAWDGAVRVARAAERLEFATIATPQNAGAAFSITVRGRDEYGAVPSNYAAAVGLSDLTATISPASVTLAAGSWTGNVTIGAAHAADQITARQTSDTAVTGTSNTFQVTQVVVAAPSNLAAVAASPTKMTLTWTDNATNETGFYVERKTGAGGTWAQIASLLANVVTFNDLTCLEATTYYYRVRAYRTGVGTSAYSNEASATTPVKPPSLLAGSATGLTTTKLTWNDNSAAETGYYVERKTGTGGTYAQVAALAANTITWNDSGLTAGATYVYRVRAYKTGVGNSTYSNEATVTTLTLPAAPSNLAAVATAPTKITLTWRDNATTENGFYIERKTGATGTYAQIASAFANAVTFTDSTCAEATTYYYRVRAYRNLAGNSAYSNEASATTPVKPPTYLAATATGLTTTKLTWRDNSAMETGYYVERKTGTGGTYAQVASLAANTITWNDSGLVSGLTYVYRVRAYRTGVGNSSYSNEATVTTLTLPAAPSNLAAAATAPTKITLTWTDNATTENGFYIERKTGAGGTYAQIGSALANATTYSDITCAEATTYYYRVRAYRNLAGTSAYSNEANATTPLKPPTYLAATATGLTTTKLTWRDNSTMETGYLVERKTGTAGTYAQVASLAANTITWNDSGLAAGTTYVYRVRAYRTGLGNSAYTNEATVTTLTLPAAPSNLAATAASPTKITLTWRDNATTENSFYIERKTGVGGTWAQVGTAIANATTYSDLTCAEATTYYYRVRAYRNLAGTSAYSNEANATTPLKPPTTLAATATGLTTTKLTWRDNSAAETGYYIERKTGTAGTYAQVASVAANTTTWNNSGLTAGTTYVYRVRAYRTGLGNSAYTNEATVTTLTLPAAPTNLTATAITATRIALAWRDNATTENGFYIERKTGAAGTWGQIGTVGANGVAFTDLTCAQGTLYYYRVRAYRNLAGTSAYTNEASATTPLGAPTLLTAVAGVRQITLSWRDNCTVETSYIVERQVGGAGEWTVVATLAANTRTWVNTGLTTGTSYSYRVRAYKTGFGSSAFSNVATATAG